MYQRVSQRPISSAFQIRAQRMLARIARPRHVPVVDVRIFTEAGGALGDANHDSLVFGRGERSAIGTFDSPDHRQHFCQLARICVFARVPDVRGFARKGDWCTPRRYAPRVSGNHGDFV